MSLPSCAAFDALVAAGHSDLAWGLVEQARETWVRERAQWDRERESWNRVRESWDRERGLLVELHDSELSTVLRKLDFAVGRRTMRSVLEHIAACSSDMSTTKSLEAFCEQPKSTWLP